MQINGTRKPEGNYFVTDIFSYSLTCIINSSTDHIISCSLIFRGVGNNCPKTCDFYERRCEDDSGKFKIGKNKYTCAQSKPEKHCGKKSEKKRVDEIFRATYDFCSVGSTISKYH